MNAEELFEAIKELDIAEIKKIYNLVRTHLADLNKPMLDELRGMTADELETKIKSQFWPRGMYLRMNSLLQEKRAEEEYDDDDDDDDDDEPKEKPKDFLPEARDKEGFKRLIE